MQTINFRCIEVPVVPARGGAEVALGIHYKTFHIYRTCMRRAPAKPVRARCVRVCCILAVQEHDLRATTLHCKVKRRLSSHFTVPFSQPCTLQGTLHLISRHTLATLDTANFYTEKLLHTEARNFCTQKLLHREAFAQKSPSILCFFSPFQPFMLYAFCQDLVVTATSSGIGPYFQGRSAHLYRL